MIIRLVVTGDLAARLQALAETQGVAVEELGLRAIALGLDILARQSSKVVELTPLSSDPARRQPAPSSPQAEALGEEQDAPDN